MALRHLDGPFSLDARTLKHTVFHPLPGVYVLGFTDSLGRFSPYYVGRSPQNVRMDLEKRRSDGHQRFAYQFYARPKDAFVSACEIYHEAQASMLNQHPASPEGLYLTCPLCSELG